MVGSLDPSSPLSLSLTSDGGLSAMSANTEFKNLQLLDGKSEITTSTTITSSTSTGSNIKYSENIQNSGHSTSANISEDVYILGPPSHFSQHHQHHHHHHHQ